MYFTITTNKETAEKIRKQFEWDEKFSRSRSLVLGKIDHHPGVLYGYSVVQIKAREGEQIKPEDIFWLGHFSANQKL